MRTSQRVMPSESSAIPAASGRWRRLIRRCAHAALIACNIAFASVVAAQGQPATRPAATEIADASSGSARAATHAPADSPRDVEPAPTSPLGSPGQRPTLVFDFDADGTPDTVRREMRLEAGELLFSRFVIVSGATGLDLDAFPAPEANDLFGWLVTSVGDLDADDVPDLAVAAPRTHTGVPGDGIRGRVFILSGATHDTLLTIDGDWWGFSGLGLVVVDDQDGDGVLDLLIGGMQRIVETDPGDPSAPEGDGALFGDPPTDEPTIYHHATWSLHSLGAGEVLESGDGVPPVRFLRPGESVQALWDSGPIPGPRLWLEGASGDLNADGVVDMQDLLRLIEALGEADRASELSSYFQIGDLNGDGAVNMSDLTALLAQYGRTASDLARERAATPRPLGAGAAPEDCTDEFGFGGGGCYITCVDCGFTVPVPGSGGGGGTCPGPDCPHCTDCTGCDDCPKPPRDCTSQCECFPCSCDADGNGTPDKDDDSDGDMVLNKNDCNSSCYTGDECECNPLNIVGDVNNDGIYDEDDDAEESESSAMMVLIVNRGDTDDDGIPDYADGFGEFGPETESGTNGNFFAPIYLNAEDVCNFQSAEIALIYDAAHPGQVTAETIEVPDIESSYRRFSRGDGLLRIWRVPGTNLRTINDFIPSGQTILGADLGPEATLYVEAVNGSAVPTTIIVRLTNARGNQFTDTIQVLPFDSQTGLDVEQITGYSVVTDGGMGTPGNDIIIGSSGNDTIDAGDGDDIIVSPPGDRIIYPGPGQDIVFASVIGDVQVIHEDTIAARGGANEDRIETYEDVPLTTKLVRKAYEHLFGANDPWMTYFLAARGSLRAVAYTEVPVGQIGRQSARDWPGKDGKRVTITFGLHPPPVSPYEVAAKVREGILEIASSNSGEEYSLRLQMLGVVQDAIASDAVRRQLHLEPGQAESDYDTLRSLAFDDAVQLAAFAGGLFIESIRFASSGADLVVTVAELLEGDYEKAINLLPLIPSVMTSGTKVAFRVGAEGRLFKANEFIQHIPCDLRSACRVPKWAHDRGVHLRYGPVVNGEKTVIIGKGHYPQASASGLEHAAHSEFLATQRAQDGTVTYITQNRTLRKSTGLDNLGAQGGKFPDLVVARRDGKFDLYEIQSCDDDVEDLIEKLNNMMSVIPPEMQGEIKFIPLTDYFDPLDCR